MSDLSQEPILLWTVEIKLVTTYYEVGQSWVSPLAKIGGKQNTAEEILFQHVKSELLPWSDLD